MKQNDPTVDAEPSSIPNRFAQFSIGPLFQWALLFGLAGVLSALFSALKINGSLFVAPMVVGLVFALAGSRLKLSRHITLVTQAVVGCIIARSLDPGILGFMLVNWSAVFFVIAGTAVASFIVALGLFRYSELDDNTAAWGSMPGAASIMVAFAADYGGDTRLVALMQYIRAIVVITTASILTSLFTTKLAHDAATSLPRSIAGVTLLDAGRTLLVGVVGIFFGRLSRLPGGILLVTALIGAALHLNGLADMALPQWFVAISYGLVGLYVGLQFDRAVLLFAVRSLPIILTGVTVLMAICGLCGLIFSHMLGVDTRTGYLATSPGGIDTIAILALGAHANMSVVMAVQTLRFFAVILTAPYLVKLIHWLSLRHLPGSGSKRKGVSLPID